MNRTTLVRSAALALIGACAPLASAEPWWSFHFGNDHGRRAPVIVQRPVIVRERPVFVPARRIEVLPADLHFSAYQAGDTVIVIAAGANRSSGFTTSFSAADVGAGTPALTLCNSALDSDCATQCPTPFSTSASFHARHAVRCISVRVAGQCYEVPVTQTQCLS